MEQWITFFENSAENILKKTKKAISATFLLNYSKKWD